MLPWLRQATPDCREHYYAAMQLRPQETLLYIYIYIRSGQLSVHWRGPAVVKSHPVRYDVWNERNVITMKMVL